MQCGKLENILSLWKRNCLPQPHASNTAHLNETLLYLLFFKLFPLELFPNEHNGGEQKERKDGDGDGEGLQFPMVARHGRRHGRLV